MDVVDSVKRSQMMSGIKGKNTKPEISIRRYLHAAGFRFRLHKKSMVGCPDLTLNKYRLVIFVHGCFWHRHEGCAYKTMPSSRIKFWEEKFSKNVERDKRQIDELLHSGWRVLIVWECGVKHSLVDFESLLNLIKGKDRWMIWPPSPPKKA
ncbi:very short patch repair endonuclease [Pseudomonas sp. stari2]|uniref:very short patch repair endonuclease n=1 Tax=Pseudomonas sp. Stari2 TaxID=2954814 RepID=UPI00345C91CC